MVTLVSFKRLARTAQSLGFQLLVENHGGITADPEVIVQIAEGVEGDPWLHTRQTLALVHEAFGA